MRNALIAAGIIGMLYGLLFFEVTVTSSSGGRVNNIGLMNDRQGILIVSGFLFVGGLLLKRAKPESAIPGSAPDERSPAQRIAIAVGVGAALIVGAAFLLR